MSKLFCGICVGTREDYSGWFTVLSAHFVLVTDDEEVRLFPFGVGAVSSQSRPNLLVPVFFGARSSEHRSILLPVPDNPRHPTRHVLWHVYHRNRVDTPWRLSSSSSSEKTANENFLLSSTSAATCFALPCKIKTLLGTLKH